MDYEELHEIRKMTRRGYTEEAADEAIRQANRAETEEQATARFVRQAEDLGYSLDEIAQLPDGITVNAGCGNPMAVAAIKPGESVLVVGYRTGADIFLAGRAAGPKGHVVGVEESPDVVSTIRAAARAVDLGKVEVRVGEDENLPVADKTFDVAVTNCAVTYSFNKQRVLREILRALKPGGRLILCEPVLRRDAAKEAAAAVRSGTEFLEGHLSADDYLRMLKKTGFKKSRVVDETALPADRLGRDDKTAALLQSGDIDESVLPIMAGALMVVKVQATRP